MKRDFGAEIDAAAAKGTPGSWLIILPASGTTSRVVGRFFVFDMGGESGLCPFVMMTGGRPITFDPRALILSDETLRPIWHPRDYLTKANPESARWYAQNPDVFATRPPR